MSSDESRDSRLVLDMPLEEAIRTQRSIRRLKPDPVDDALVLHLLELAMYGNKPYRGMSADAAGRRR